MSEARLDMSSQGVLVRGKCSYPVCRGISIAFDRAIEVYKLELIHKYA
jgi:hypothetical protein